MVALLFVVVDWSDARTLKRWKWVVGGGVGERRAMKAPGSERLLLCVACL
jgi:hypothetical protein